MTINDQFDAFITQISTRKRSPTKPATLAAYRSYYKNWIAPQIGSLELSKVENGVMKQFVAHLAESGLAPASIAGVTQLVKGIVASAMDKNGNPLFPRVWNAEFIDAPMIDHNAQKTPLITAQEASRAVLMAPGQYSPLFALAAGSGCRISEILAIRVGIQPVSSYWDPQESKLVIRKALYHGREQGTKTAAGVREVDLDPQLNDYLINYFKGIRNDGEFLFRNDTGGPLRPNTAYDVAEQRGVPGFHSFRRFRCTHLENVGVPRGLAMFWTGHAKKDVHDGYVRLDKDIEARRDWAKRAGIGFELPKTGHPQVSMAEIAARA